jgi:outer membrane immunogenic protein
LLCAVAAAAVAAPASADWSGLYIGGHVGGTWGDIETTNVSDTTTFFTSDNSDFSPEGALAGAQIGYNLAFSKWVVGLEVSGTTLDFDEVLRADDDQFQASVDWLGVASLRAGYEVSPRAIVYLKGGYATGNVQTRVIDTLGGATGTFATDETHGGWMAGAGYERLISSDVTVALEYNYIDLGNQDHRGPGSTGGVAVNDADVTMHAVNVRLNWQFWSP